MDRETYQKLLDLVNAKNEVERQLKKLEEEIRKIGITIKPETLEDYTYDEIKIIWDSVKYDVESLPEFDKIIERKKLEKYPEMEKAVYYPEINALPISDTEKIRLDRAARRNYRSFINNYNMNKHRDPLSEEDLERLKEIDIVEKKFAFMCPECGCSAITYSEEDIQKFLRTWELELISKNGRKLTEKEMNELDTLYDDGYMDINVSCLDCDEGFETISSKEEFEEYKERGYVTPVYYIAKAPDLSFEKL